MSTDTIEQFIVWHILQFTNSYKHKSNTKRMRICICDNITPCLQDYTCNNFSLYKCEQFNSSEQSLYSSELSTL